MENREANIYLDGNPNQGEQFIAHKLVIIGDVGVGKSSIIQR